MYWICLAGMELISFIIACMVLWFEFVTRTVLTTYQYFCCCWTALVQPQGVYFGFFYSAPQVRRLTTPIASGVKWINYLFACTLNFFFTYWTVSLSVHEASSLPLFPILKETRVSKQWCGCLTAGRNQPTTNVDIKEQTIKD